MKLRDFFALAIVTSLASSPLWAATKAAVDRPAIISAKARHSLLIDASRAGKRLVAVGERGHVVYSDDEGQSWSQATVPVSVMLTGVHFANAQEGWAVGHAGVILYSADAGAHWKVQHVDKDGQGDKNGAPFLDVWFADNKNGYAVGAYGYFMATHDGGNTWSDASSALQNVDGWHLNTISGVIGTNTVLIGGEHGTLFRSQDSGGSWQTLPSPFDGSFFGISTIAPDLVLASGLQGRLYRSEDQGTTWQQVASGVTSGLNSAVALSNGHILVVGNAGVILNSADAGFNFISETRADRQSIMAALSLAKGGVLTVGDGGVKVLPASK